MISVLQPDVEAQEKESSSVSSLPYWLCQPYIRPESVNYLYAFSVDTGQFLFTCITIIIYTFLSCHVVMTSEVVK